VTPLILTADEARLAAADKLTEIRRPVEPQPDPEYVRAEIVGRWCHFEDELGPPNERGNREGKMFTVNCPFGVPGELLYACEEYAPGYYPTNPPPQDNAYRADSAGLRFDEIPEPPRWCPASRMPLARSRFAYRGRVRVELTDGAWQWVLAVERVNREDGAPMPPVECQ